MRPAILCIIVLAAQCGAEPAKLVVVSDEPEFLSSSQRQQIERYGWKVERLSVAEGTRLKHVRPDRRAPVFVYGQRAVTVGDGAEIVRLASKLADGKQTYKFACTRCHGEDGNNDAYLNIRKLGGIGARLTNAEIEERLRALPLGSDFTVRGHIVSRESLDALVAYIAGL